MVNNRKKEEWIDLFINQFLKDQKNLPYTIQTCPCPEKNNQCKRPHKGMVVDTYYDYNGTFLVTFFQQHNNQGYSKIVESNLLKEFLLEGIKFRVFNTNHLKKKLDLSSVFSTERLQTRVTVEEKKIIEKIAKSKNMSVSEYLRKQALS